MYNVIFMLRLFLQDLPIGLYPLNEIVHMYSFCGFSQSLREGDIQSRTLLQKLYTANQQLSRTWNRLQFYVDDWEYGTPINLLSVFEDIIYMYVAIGKTKTELIVQTS